jgi:DNA uptake protein ComE-like DNA-binding protein
LPNWKEQIKSYFIFSKKESRGIFILLALLFLVIIFNILLPFLITQEKTDFSEFEKEIAQLDVKKEPTGLGSDKKTKKGTDRNIDYSAKIKPFIFDPNDLPVEDWKRMGLDDRQIKMIKNYEAKGGNFREKQDLADIYSISEEEYRILEPYISIKKKPEQKEEKESVLKPFDFDPNILPKEKWLEMGLRENVADAIVNYREKGGKFYTNSDLKKIYTLKENEYIQLEPFISIEKETPPKPPVKEKIIVALNEADTLDLQQLPGIGPSFARRIVKYRDLLGGYCSKEQLLEVYGMDSTRYAGISEWVTIDAAGIRKMDINTVTIKELLKHPYFELYTAKSILNYRKEIGQYTEVVQIRDARLVYDQLYKKIEPYLTINQK